VQFFLLLPGRSKDSKEKENRKSNTRRGGWFAESAGRLSSRLILVAII
jgi:hypothetical protein